MAWFKKQKTTEPEPPKRSKISEGMWLKCNHCREIVYRKEVERNNKVCASWVGTEAFEQSRRERKRIEMRFAHLKRILRLGRLRLRGPRGAQDEFTLAAIAQNLRQMAKLITPMPAIQA